MGRVPVFQLFQQLVDQPTRVVTLVNGNEIIEVYYNGTNNFGSIYAATYGRGLFRSDNFFKVDIDEIFAEDDAGLNLKVYPNPVIQQATVELVSRRNAEVTLQVFDLSGRMIISRTEMVQPGVNRLQIDMSSLKKGTYIVRTSSGTNTQTQKVIVN
jgi:hypothetical protein